MHSTKRVIIENELVERRRLATGAHRKRLEEPRRPKTLRLTRAKKIVEDRGNVVSRQHGQILKTFPNFEKVGREAAKAAPFHDIGRILGTAVGKLTLVRQGTSKRMPNRVLCRTRREVTRCGRA